MNTDQTAEQDSQPLEPWPPIIGTVLTEADALADLRGETRPDWQPV